MIRRMIAGQLLPWSRFWTSPAGRLSAGHDGRGFLDDPEDELGRAMNPELHLLSELLARSCLVLSGQPGIGKTTEVDALAARSMGWLAPDETLIALTGRLLLSPEAIRQKSVDSPQWRAAIEGGGRVRLLIDGVDEALRRVSVLVPALVDALKDQPIERVTVILVCRAAEWHLADGQALAALWGEDATSLVFELCPLRWKDAELAARLSDVDPEAFFRELVRHQVKGLAARPITLRLLLEEMRAGGSLPGSHHELFSNAIRRLCEEIDEERARHLPGPRPSASHIARVAGRIAALTMLGGRNVVVRSADLAEPGELPMDEIATGQEAVEGDRFLITPALVSATLDTPLFSFRGPERYGFDHQTFAEHLAANYLSGCTPTQLRRLLTVSFEGHERVAPQLAEVAARVATTNSAWCDHLINTEPELLLRADASPLSDDQRERAIASLLSRAEREEAFDEAGTGYFYHTLQHPKLAAQLRPYIQNPDHNPVVRRMALDIAGDAGVIELEPLLWERIEARDPAFGGICKALLDIAGPQSTERLLAALRGELPDNEGNDLKDLALSKLVPRVLPVRNVVPYLTSPPRDHTTFAYGLSKHLVVGDLPAVLAAMESGRFVGHDHFALNELAARAFEMAVENLERPEVAAALARYWRACVRNYHPLPSRMMRKERDPLAGLEGASARRALTRLVVGLPGADVHDIDRGESRLIGKDDLEWLLEELKTVPPEQREIWAKLCAQQTWQGLVPQTEDLLRRRYAEFSELQTVLPKPGRYDIATTIQRQRRSHELRMERMRERNSRRWRKRSRTERMEPIWRELETNDTVWVGFCDRAWLTENSDPKRDDHADRGDIAASPAWLAADEPRRAGLRIAARRFLLTRRDGGRKKGTWTNWADAACFAIALLLADLDTDLELKKAVSTRWPRVVFDDHDRGSAAQRAAVAAVYRIVPEIAIARLAAKLQDDNRRDGYLIDLNRYVDCWDARLVGVLQRFLLARRVTPRAVRRAFQFLDEHDHDSAVVLFDEMVARRGGFRPADARGRALLAVGLFLLAAERWDVAWIALQQLPAPTAKNVFFEAAHDFIDRDGKFQDALNTAQLTALCSRVWKLFPRGEYSERHDENGHVSSRHMLPDLREGLTATLVTRATPKACASLRWLATQVPSDQRIWMRWRHHEAIKNALRRTWTARSRSSVDLLAMMRDFRALTIDTADDLLEAVIASVERLQHRLKNAESPELHALWNEPNRGAPPTPKDEAVLSNVVHDWIQRDLGPNGGIVLNREVQATLLSKLDIKVEAVPKRGVGPPLTLIIEVKGDWHREIAKALGEQLATLFAREWLDPRRLSRRLVWKSTTFGHAEIQVASLHAMRSAGSREVMGDGAMPGKFDDPGSDPRMHSAAALEECEIKKIGFNLIKSIEWQFDLPAAGATRSGGSFARAIGTTPFSPPSRHRAD